MAPSRPRNASSKKSTSKAPVPEEKRPYTLVFYEPKGVTKKGTKGVVETKSIPPKLRVQNMTCLAPDPIDWSEKGPDNGKKHKAKIIAFGSE